MSRPKLDLVAYRPEFLKEFSSWRRERAAVRHNPFKSMSDAELSQMLLRESASLKSDYGKCDAFRWFLLHDGALAGNFSLKNISVMMATGEIGYGVAEALHGQGIGTEAVRHGVAKIFSESPIRRLIAFVHTENLASCRLLEKLGFKREGVLREHYIINGKPVDEALYAILKSEFQAS